MGKCFSCFKKSQIEDVAAWLEVLANPEYLDWRRRRSGSATPFSLRHQQQIEQMQQTLPVRVDRNLWLSDARSARRLGRVKFLEVTHVLDLEGSSRESMFVNAGMVYKRIEARDAEGYQLLPKHLDEAMEFIGSARKQGGECMVFCSSGLDLAGAICAADIMLTNQTTVLEVVRELRQKRGNACLQNSSFQLQLVELAKTNGLLGPEPGHPDSVVTTTILERSRPANAKFFGAEMAARTASGGSERGSYVGETFEQSFKKKLKREDSATHRAAAPDEEDLPYLQAMIDTKYLDWRTRIDPETGEIPDAAQRDRIEKEQGNLPVQISESVFLSDSRAAKRIGRLKFIGITHVLNVAGPDTAPPSMEAYAEAHLLYRMIDAADRPRYPVLKRHLREAQEFIRSARASGGRCLVYCSTGYDLSGLIVAADRMLHQRHTLLDVLAHCRRQRGNAFMSCQGFQCQLLDLARTRNLLGDPPVLQEAPSAGVAGAMRRVMTKKRKKSTARTSSVRADVVEIRTNQSGPQSGPRSGPAGDVDPHITA